MNILNSLIYSTNKLFLDYELSALAREDDRDWRPEFSAPAARIADLIPFRFTPYLSRFS